MYYYVVYDSFTHIVSASNLRQEVKVKTHFKAVLFISHNKHKALVFRPVSVVR